MLRALVKGSALAAINHLPGGPRAYRELTRVHLGTQASHVDKLSRVLPGYLEAWRERADLPTLEGLRLWIHEPGWTPFWPLAAHLLGTERSVLTNVEARMLPRYLTRAVNGVLALDLPAAAERRRRVEAQRWQHELPALLEAVDAELHQGCEPCRLPLGTASVDLAHSGGALEHLPLPTLRGFLRESFRIVRPGGLVSHVFDHRDHLRHADRSWPFLAHLALPDAAYRALLGGPLTYHSRLSPSRVAALFGAVGFERIAVRRLVLPAGRYAEQLDEAEPGLRRARLAPEHRALSTADLHTAAAHYLFRRV